MRAIPRKSGKTTTYYLTRRRPVSHENPDYADLPLRSHESVRRQAEDIEGTMQDQAKKNLQIQHGIRGKVCDFDSLGILSLISLGRRLSFL